MRVRKDGQLVHVLLTISSIQDRLGNVVGNATVVHDITEAQAFGSGAGASEESLRTVLANAPLILFAFDRDGRSTVRAGRALAGFADYQGMSRTTPPISLLTTFMKTIPRRRRTSAALWLARASPAWSR